MHDINMSSKKTIQSYIRGLEVAEVIRFELHLVSLIINHMNPKIFKGHSLIIYWGSNGSNKRC